MTNYDTYASVSAEKRTAGYGSLRPQSWNLDDGQVEFSFQVERFRGGDGVVYIICGDQPVAPHFTDSFGEGDAERIVHAVYIFDFDEDDLSVATDWPRQVMDLDPEGEVKNKTQLEESLELHIEAFNQRVAAGAGSWIHGDRIFSKRVR